MIHARRHMVFDVESVGLHGEGFAVGWVIMDGGLVVDESWGFVVPGKACGTRTSRGWVSENCKWLGWAFRDFTSRGMPAPRTFDNTAMLRDWFWNRWLDEKAKDAMLWADTGWPVEARFLIACVEDARATSSWSDEQGDTSREWEGPYPLMDVSTLVRAGLVNTHAKGELGMAHHPLADARYSAQILARFLKQQESQ